MHHHHHHHHHRCCHQSSNEFVLPECEPPCHSVGLRVCSRRFPNLSWFFFSHTHVPKDRKSHHGARVPASRPGHIRQPPHKWKPYPLLQQVYSGKLASLHDQSKFQKWKKGIGWRNASNAQETEGDNIATLRLRAIYVCKIATCKNASNQVFKLHVTTGNKTSNWIGLVIQHLDMYVPVRHIFAHWFAYILGQRLAHWPSSRLESFSRKSANPSEVRRTLTQDRLSFIKGMWSTLSMMWNCVDWQFFLENESFGDSPSGKFPCPCLPACPRNKKTNWHSRVLCKQKYIITKSHVHGMPSFKSIPCCSTLSLHCRMAFWSAAQKNRGPETQFLDLKSYNTLCCSQPSIVFLNPTCNHTHHPSQHNVSRRAPCDGHKSPRFAPWNMLAKIVNSGSEAIKTHGLLLLPQFFPFHDPSNCQPFVPGCGDQRVEHHWVGWDQCCSAHHDNACRDFVMTMAFCGGHIRPSMERTCRYCLWAWCLREQVGSVLLPPQESKYIWRYCGSDRVSTGAGRWRHGSLALLR